MIRRRLKPWQVERLVRELLAERDRRLAALRPATRFQVGQRVRVVGGERNATVTAVVAGSKVTRYRLEGRKFLYFENDLEAVR
jgi:hypothetical protein